MKVIILTTEEHEQIMEWLPYLSDPSYANMILEIFIRKLEE